MFGKDLNKPGDREKKPKVPESLGIVVSIVYLLVTINEQLLFNFENLESDKTSPAGWFGSVWFGDWYSISDGNNAVIKYNAALLSICLVSLLGFIDDVVDLKWRYKLIVPTIATFPLLVAYNGLTSVIVPKVLRPFIGHTLELGLIYRLYMGSLAVFCTNSINIFAGINGIEVGQSFIIGCFIFLHNVIEINLNLSAEISSNHIFSLTLMVPFLFVSLALLKHNQFPSKVFIGDTYCYFAGMTFAVCGILSHFSKTMLLFFLPQIFNFVLSLPQILGIVHCPRHRLPKFNPDTYKLECVDNHYTIINFFLRVVGPMNEQQACSSLLIVQALSCILGLVLRYYGGSLLF
mmetsp:Transcript_33685/g.24716  ORF Transcript_33685/g.24716 Transcript_33685/m.24716 type:complete len:348 (-) Transcript_33685:30-1073(-)